MYSVQRESAIYKYNIVERGCTKNITEPHIIESTTTHHIHM